MRTGLAICALVLAPLLAALPAPPAPAQEPGPERAEARAIVKDFAGALKAALKAAIDEKGFEHAIGVCRSEAPGIAAALSERTGWRVGRTALRLRNPANAPTAEERAVLEDFLARAAAGEPLQGMEHEAVAARDGARSYHYMKAIPVQELCTTCHGKNVDPGLAAAIRARYPEDRATGFAVGELRGAFTLSKPLE
jgi:hypothetical protein